jgi:hypothetical protein
MTFNDEWYEAQDGTRYEMYGYLIVIDGHVSADTARAVVTEVLSRPPFLDVESIARRVWARTITECPTHSQVGDDQCDACLALGEYDEWWDWSTPDGQPNANANAEGYVPLTLVGLG